MENQTTTTSITGESKIDEALHLQEESSRAIWEKVLKEAERNIAGPDAAFDVWFRY